MALSGAKYEMAQLGQFGSIFTNAAGLVTPPDGYIICAIQFLSNTTFNTLTPENSDSGDRVFVNGDTAAHAAGSGSEGTGGVELNTGEEGNLTIFPQGMTIYGRWTTMSIDADADGGVIAYLAPKH